MWWALASTALSFLSQESQASDQRELSSAQYTLDTARQNLNNQLQLSQSAKSYNQALQVANQQLNQISATNDAIAEANTTNTLAANYKAGLLQLQAGMAKKQQVAERVAIREAGGNALGSANANAAASGTIGASVDQVSKDITRQMGEALVQEDEKWDIQAQNFQTQGQDIYMNLEQQLQSGVTANSIIMPTESTVVLQDSVQQSLVPSTAQNLLGSVANTALQYASQRISLGLGSSSATPWDTSNVYGGNLNSSALYNTSYSYDF